MAAITQDQIIEAVEAMTMLQVSELVKAMEEKFGVSAAAPVAVGGGAGPAAAAVEEQTEFSVILKAGVPADKKVSIIKEVKAITGLGLKEAKELVEAGDKPLKEGVSKDEANKIAELIKAAGGAVDIK